MLANEWIQQAAQCQREGRAFALVTVLRVQAPTSSKPGDKALVLADGSIHGWIGGGCAQPAVLRTVRQALADGRARTVRISPSAEGSERDLGDVLEFGMACQSGGALELFVDPVLPDPLLAVFGNTPLARALVALAPHLGLRLAWIAPGLKDGESDGVQRLGKDVPDFVRERLPACDFAVVATQGQRDLQALRGALALQPRRLWFVASARKAGVLRESLIAGGADRAAVEAIIAPAGTPIQAHTPQEIALSVLAAVVAARRSGQASAAPQQAPTAPASAQATAIAASGCGS